MNIEVGRRHSLKFDDMYATSASFSESSGPLDSRNCSSNPLQPAEVPWLVSDGTFSLLSIFVMPATIFGGDSTIYMRVLIAT